MRRYWRLYLIMAISVAIGAVVSISPLSIGRCIAALHIVVIASWLALEKIG